LYGDERSDCGGRRGPDQEDGIDTGKAAVESLGDGEISLYDLDMRRQRSRLRIPSHRAHRYVLCRELQYDFAAYGPCGANDKYSIHRPASRSLHPRRGHAHKCRAEELALGVEFPVELGGAAFLQA